MMWPYKPLRAVDSDPTQIVVDSVAQSVYDTGIGLNSPYITKPTNPHTTMAFGTGSARSFGPNAVLYSFQIKTKDLPAPIFKVQKKVGDKYEDQDNATRVSGNLISATPKENLHQGKTIKSVNLVLQDGNDVYFVSVGYTYIGRNLLNALFALKTFDEVEISVYQSKPKPGKTKTYASVCLRQHGETVRGLIPNEQLPAIPKVELNGEQVSNQGPINTFFEEKAKAWCKVVNAAAPKPAQSSAPASTESHSAEDVDHAGESTGEGEDDPLAPPF